MASRLTDVEYLIDFCGAHYKGANWGTEDQVVGFLTTKYKWRSERASNALHRALSDQSEIIYVGKGNTIRYADNDRSLYKPTAQYFEKFAKYMQFRLRNVNILHTAHNGCGRGGGMWRHPDLLVLADPARRRSANACREVHAVEIEAVGGMDIRSVYQAYEEGRGADYRWVFWKRGVADVHGHKRILLVAKELGVGLVEMARPTEPSKWTMHLRAKRNEHVTFSDRVDLLKRNGCHDAERYLNAHEVLSTSAAVSVAHEDT